MHFMNYQGTNRPHAPRNALADGTAPGSTVLVLGILGLLLCGVLSPLAWVLGGRSIRRGGEDEGLARAGRALGVIGTLVLVVLIALRLTT